MSDYRDDEVSSAIATETYTAGWGERIQEAAAATASLFLVVNLLFSDGAQATDELTQHTITSSFDTVVATDEFVATYLPSNLITDLAVAGDSLLVEHVTEFGDSATASDSTSVTSLAVSEDAVLVTETLVDIIGAKQELTDSVFAKDLLTNLHSDKLSETVTGTDQFVLTGGRVEQVHDTATVADSIDETVLSDDRVVETGIASDSVQHHLAARQTVTEFATAYDELSRTAGAAWTANVAAFATSRYENYDFTSIAVIRGVLYGTRSDGVFRLDGVGSDEVVPAIAQFPSMDVSGSQLGTPRWVYLGYESDSEVTLDVVTEQSGNKVEFSYKLPAERADSSTTGRFTLGRGLRGRYYSFRLSSTGMKFKAFEMTAVVESTKRRV